jgi:hypothetical protein
MLVRLKPDTTYARSGLLRTGQAEAGHYVRAERAATYAQSGCTSAISCGPIDGSWQSRPTIRASIGETQERRSGHADLVRPTPVGSIAAHEAIVIGQLRAFFRGANRRSA